jgi:protein MpaA
MTSSRLSHAVSAAAVMVVAAAWAPTSSASSASSLSPSASAASGVHVAALDASSAVVVPTSVGGVPVPAPSGFRCRAVHVGAVTVACTIGRSVDGRALVAERQGNAAARRVLVVIGQMHGEEWPGPLTVDVLRAIPTSTSAGYAIWTVRSMNPDGGAIGRRWNSHGVNLNANFPNKFVPGTRAGRRALSEPESRAIARFLVWIQPDLVISLHGFSTAVDTTGGGRRAAWARTFSKLSGIMPAHVVPCGGPCHGNMTDWYTATSRVQGVAFTVVMPRTSRLVRACAVPGRPRGTTIQCAAWAAAYLARRLPA